MKKTKWILLIILLISILITAIIFINFFKTKSNNSNNNVNNNLNNIYNKNWYITSLIVIDGNKETFRNDSYNNKYIIISESTIEFCDLSSKKCFSDEYVYHDNKILISTYNSLGPGDYEIELVNDTLKLSRKEDNDIVSYYFEEAKG